MTDLAGTGFEQPGLLATLDALDSRALDNVGYGVIGFDADGTVQRYNAIESELAALPSHRVLGQAFFTAVAPCMNNFLVAQRFEDAATGETALDATLDYVLTLRMRPEKVKLRLLAGPGIKLRYVLVMRRA